MYHLLTGENEETSCGTLDVTDHRGWYPPRQVCSPPELPTYLKNVYDLKPIVGLPNDAEVIGIHTVIQAANRASSIPGMHDPGLIMKLSDHLFGAQMAVYRSKYTSLLFPSDATYTPPALPTHVTVNLEPISCAPTDEQISKVHEAMRSYQKFSEIPSMFEPQVHADLSQHLFDIQMARYMSCEGQRLPNSTHHEATQTSGPTSIVEPATNTTEEAIAHDMTNNAGTGSGVTCSPHIQEDGIRSILERSNQLAEQANQLIERSNQIAEQSTQLIERSLSNHPVEKPSPPTDQSNTTTTEQLGELLGRLTQYLDRSNQLAEGFKNPVEHLGDALRTINKVLVGIQHAIVRGHKDNTFDAVKSLVNEKGEFPTAPYFWFTNKKEEINFKVGAKGVFHSRGDNYVSYYLRFYGIEGDFYKDPEKTEIREGKKADARERLGRYWTSALGL
ncbi:hypothetical protein OPQ81_005302 [Rhizoctonia solani]|nr:hypothetical protein OPQ81_005302 [Rhizoctonia solani]